MMAIRFKMLKGDRPGEREAPKARLDLEAGVSLVRAFAPPVLQEDVIVMMTFSMERLGCRSLGESD